MHYNEINGMPWCPRCGGYHHDGCPKAEMQMRGGVLGGPVLSNPLDLRQLTDHVLEETFQSWLKASTLPGNIEEHRKHLRRRIDLMVEKAQLSDKQVTATVIDLTRLS